MKIIFPKSNVLCLWWELVSDLPVIILTHELFSPTLFTAPCPAEKGECESTWRVAGSWPRSNHHLRKAKVLSINEHFSLSNAESKLMTAIYETEKNLDTPRI